MGQINPETGSDIEMEDNGDFTITFTMALPPQSTPDTVETCRAEYQAGSDVRARLDEQIRNGR